ncbi:MAG: hypothetical protein WDN08_04650 [Rhizomicrobium sp.]
MDEPDELLVDDAIADAMSKDVDAVADELGRVVLVVDVSGTRSPSRCASAIAAA